MGKKAKKGHPIKAVRKVAKGRGKLTQRGSPSNAKRVMDVENAYAVVQLRKMGHTVHEIAEAMKMGEQRVRNYIKDTLFKAINDTAETVEENRQLQIDRLDSLLKQYMPLCEPHHEKMIDKATGQEVVWLAPPNPIYAQLVLSIEARRSKLLALDKAVDKGGDTPPGVREYVGVDVDKV